MLEAYPAAPQYTLATMAEAERPHLAVEGAQRARVAAASVAAGLLLFGGALWTALIEAKDPSVGVLQGLAPALHGLAVNPIDPRTVHEQFLVHHQTMLILAWVVSSLGAIAMIFPLRYLAAAERARSATPSMIPSYLAQYAPLLIALFVPAYEIGLLVGAHNYLSHSARTADAITAASGGGLRYALFLIATVGQLAVTAAFVMISMRASRVGLITRMMSGIGVISGVLFLIPLTPLPVVQALWLVFLGASLLEFGGRPLPEAWASGVAVPWPPQQPRQPRQPRQARPARPVRGGRTSPPPAPEPVVPRGPSPSASKKRKRRR